MATRVGREWIPDRPFVPPSPAEQATKLHDEMTDLRHRISDMSTKHEAVSREHSNLMEVHKILMREIDASSAAAREANRKLESVRVGVTILVVGVAAIAFLCGVLSMWFWMGGAR